MISATLVSGVSQVLRQKTFSKLIEFYHPNAGKVRVQYPVDCSCERKGQLHEILTAVLNAMVVRLFKRMYHKSVYAKFLFNIHL